MRCIAFSLLIPYCLLSYSQDGHFNFGARYSGLAGASVTIGDQYCLFNNVGGLGLVENHSVFAGYQNRYGLPEFQVIGVGAVYMTKFINTGIGYYRFGDDLFNQQRIHVALGNKIQMVSLGGSIDIVQYHVKTVGTKRVVAFQFGGNCDNQFSPPFLVPTSTISIKLILSKKRAKSFLQL